MGVQFAVMPTLFAVFLGRFAGANRALAKHSSVVRTNRGLSSRLIGID